MPIPSIISFPWRPASARKSSGISRHGLYWIKSGSRRSKGPNGGSTEPESSVVPSVAWSVGAVVAIEDALVVASTGAASFAASGVDELVDSLLEIVAVQAVWI